MQSLSLGKHNPRLMDLRKAVHQGTLTRDGLLPVEGPKLVAEAQRSHAQIESVFLRRGAVLESPTAGAILYEIEPAVYRTIQSTESSQGIIALVRPRTFSLVDLLKTPNPLLVVLARLRDPGNAGTILRVAESFQAAGCIGLQGTVSLFNSKTVRASAGSLFRLPCVWDADAGATFASLKGSGVPVIGTSPTAVDTIDRWDWKEPAAVMIGNEGTGLLPEELGECDTVLRIPHSASVESLNSALAAAVIFYEAFKQRKP